MHGRGQGPAKKRGNGGYRFLHTALDDRTRLAYSEILDDEQGATAAACERSREVAVGDHANSRSVIGFLLA